MPMHKAIKPIELIGVPIDCAGPMSGCLHGPAALRAAGLFDRLMATGREVRDAGDLILRESPPVSHGNPRIRRLVECAGWVRTLQHAARQIDLDEVVPVFLGGDHLMAAGTIPPIGESARAAGRPFFVLWLDAHADFHSLSSTRSGNLHGTPAAYVCGQPGFVPVFPALNAALAPAHLCQLGVRSVDDAEQCELSASGSLVITMAELNRRGVHAALQPFLNRVRQVDGHLHLSFDVDCLDPRIAPGVGTAVAHGIDLPQATQVMRMVRDSCTLGSVDIAELNPIQDSSNRTSEIVVALISELFAAPPSEQPIPSNQTGVEYV